MRRLVLAASVVPLGLAGCTVSHDRYGNPNGVGVFLAASEQPTDVQRATEAGIGIAESVAPYLPAPWGQLVSAGAAAAGVGVLGRRSRQRAVEAEQRVRAEADRAWDEASARAREVAPA